MVETLGKKRTLTIDQEAYDYYDLGDFVEKDKITRLPYSLRVVLENVIRSDQQQRTKDGKRYIDAILNRKVGQDILIYPARILMQDFTGVPAIVDLSSLRDAVRDRGGDPTVVNPNIDVDLVIDHSIMVDHYGTKEAFDKNITLEFERNDERYRFLKWAEQAFNNFRVVPPGTGICHQVNLEFLAKVVCQKKKGQGNKLLYPDIVFGTDSHTTMVNGLSVLGWGVGGIEAEACLLGQPYPMLVPEVVGVKLTGNLPELATATDLVLTITHLLRKMGVVGKFVEFFGEGVSQLNLADRATIANMAPEYGATCGFFPIDEKTLDYLKLTGRPEQTVNIIKAYAQSQNLWLDPQNPDPVYDAVLELDLATIEPTLAGPKRPQDRVPLAKAHESCLQLLEQESKNTTQSYSNQSGASLRQGDVVIAAITSCTNTSNPSVMIAAGLVARKARQLGLQTKPWVKTSLAPGSVAVTEYYREAGLLEDLEALGFNLVGYGCTTCIGNSGQLNPDIAQIIDDHQLTVAAVLSGNRNFEGRVHPQVKANYLASPPLVVAYALKGTMNEDLLQAPISEVAGKAIFLKDIWPSREEIQFFVDQYVTQSIFKSTYYNGGLTNVHWDKLEVDDAIIYPWEDSSTYIKRPNFFSSFDTLSKPLNKARILALLGDSITTDHISPAGSIHSDSPAAHYLVERDVSISHFNSYGSRRGNHEVMARGTLANIRIRNEMLPDKVGGVTRHFPSKEIGTIYDIAMRYEQEDTPLVIIAGKEYGTGSSRDWAAKGTRLLGVKAVIAESFERIHRSNLVGMGVVPLEFKDGVTRQSLQLAGNETITLSSASEKLSPQMDILCEVEYPNHSVTRCQLKLRIDSDDEMAYFHKGGILPFVLEELLKN